MARPIKEGLDYFPLNVDIDADDKIAMIEALHGLQGFGIIIKLFMKIYKEGYFYEWTRREQVLFSKRVNVDINIVKEVVNDAINEGLFDKNIFDAYQVLTSRGIQERYLEAVKRRKEVRFLKNYYLLCNITPILGTSQTAVLVVDDTGNEVNVNINSNSEGVNVNKSTQRKEKKSKVKNINNIVEGEKVKFSSIDMENAKLLFEKMLDNNPDAKKPNFDKWADEFRLIRERDNRPDKHVKGLIHWTQNDEFWKTNILSPSKLRKQWDKLILRVKADHAKSKQLAIGTNTRKVDWEALADE